VGDLTFLTTADRNFIKFVQSHVREYGVKIIWGRGKDVNCGGYRASALFDESNKVIRVARQSPLWLINLIHEYAHFLQWIDGSEIFRKSNNSGIIIDNWFAGKEYSAFILKRAFLTVREMERDCEMRAAELIRKYNLSIHKRTYIKYANLYIYTHFIMEDTRKYYSYKRSPYRSFRLLNAVSDSFKVKSHKHIPKNIYKNLYKLTIA